MQSLKGGSVAVLRSLSLFYTLGKNPTFCNRSERKNSSLASLSVCLQFARHLNINTHIMSRKPEATETLLHSLHHQLQKVTAIVRDFATLI
jgi:hypothetical protein